VLLAGDDSGSGRVTTTPDPTVAAVGKATIENGVQYVDIDVQAGYSPQTTQATAGQQTVIRMHTKNTYDCSSIVVIPSLGYQKSLDPTGVVEIPVSADKAQGTIDGRCGMGMYRFSIVFS